MSRLARPLNRAAVRAANNEFYANHPELIKNGKRVPISSQSDLQKEWIKLYEKHGGKVEDNSKAHAKKPDDIVQRCPCQSIPFDKSKFSEERKKYEQEIKQGFPNLGDNYEILAPATRDYNCIAHTLGVSDEWVNPETGNKENPLSEMDKKYAKKGYKRTSIMDTSYDPTKNKVVVYATKNFDGSIKEITHGAIQDGKGTFESKLGSLPLIRHSTPEALNGDVYGEPVATYTK